MFGNAAYGPIVIITCHLIHMKIRVQNLFRARRGQKYALYQKMLQIKVVEH